jgi:hypothetical protein
LKHGGRRDWIAYPVRIDKPQIEPDQDREVLGSNGGAPALQLSHFHQVYLAGSPPLLPKTCGERGLISAARAWCGRDRSANEKPSPEMLTKALCPEDIAELVVSIAKLPARPWAPEVHLFPAED